MVVKPKKRVIYLIITASIFFLFISPNWNKPQIIEGEWDISGEVLSKGYEIYLKEESDFDYKTPIIYNMAKEIKSRTSSAEEAVKLTIRTVADTIRYSSKISIDYCYDEKASTVAEVGFGDCVSMSRLVTALLRAQGIPARTMGGCLSSSRRCIPLFSTIPYLEPQVTEMVEGDFKKRGYLHEWIEVWTPEEELKGKSDGGWRLIESTSGQIFEISCVAYKSYSYDSNPYDRCVINSASFWESCRIF